ncbi:hypothetical protein Leryth_014731 [Lithospermum erythrorhizon]|nr:hypothetical protein Leryth_014731 [Lithospermum erythrorhizon]
MSSTASLHSNLSLPSSSNSLRDCRLLRKQKRLAFGSGNGCRSKYLSLRVVRSVLDKRKSSIRDDDDMTGPARAVLERLFAQTQKLEQQIGRDPDHPQAVELGLNLDVLESDVHAALAALKKREDDLQNAERKLLLDYDELNRAKEELERREEKITVASSKQEKLENELRQASIGLASQAREIEDLKLSLKEKNQEILAAQSALPVKEDEINKVNTELMKKEEEAANVKLELESNAQLLDATHKIVENQENELQHLRRALQEKEAELEASIELQNISADNMKIAEATLEKQTVDWLVAQEELRKLAEGASKSSHGVNKTIEDFRRVKNLLADVKSELISSQEALVSSRKKMECQESLLEKLVMELREQRKSFACYISNLKDAEIEVEAERVKLRVADAQNNELEKELAIEKELFEDLQKQFNTERASLEKAHAAKSSLQKDLDLKNTEFEESQNVLQVKESELVEARLEIYHLKAAHTSLQQLLEEKDLELIDTRKALEVVNQEIIDLRLLMNSTEEQLLQAKHKLKERDEHVNAIQHELSDTKFKYSEAEHLVQQILELTDKLVTSANDGANGVFKSPELLQENSDDSRLWMKQLETELELTKENLRAKEMEVMNVQRALTVKNEELKLVRCF